MKSAEFGISYSICTGQHLHPHLHSACYRLISVHRKQSWIKIKEHQQVKEMLSHLQYDRSLTSAVNQVQQMKIRRQYQPKLGINKGSKIDQESEVYYIQLFASIHQTSEYFYTILSSCNIFDGLLNIGECYLFVGLALFMGSSVRVL